MTPWRAYELMKLVTLCALVVVVLGGTVFLNFKIAERNLDTAAEIEQFKQAVREEIRARFRAEQELAQAERAQIHDEASEAKDLATKALAKPNAVVLAVKTPLPVRVVGAATPMPTETPGPLPSPTQSTDPHSGSLLNWFR